jgi:hypothetical protein
MNTSKTTRRMLMQITNDIFYVGVNDHNVDLFEGAEEAGIRADPIKRKRP